MVKNKLRFLVLTDHSGHSAENSIYALLRTLQAQEAVEAVLVASRGNKANDGFFLRMDTLEIWAHPVSDEFVFWENGKQFLDKTICVFLHDFDAVFMRLPRPISDGFLFFLKQNTENQVVVNHPDGILKTSTKEYLLNFEQWCPPIKMCRSASDLEDFAAQFPIVLKPLKDYGGKGVVRVEDGQVHDGHDYFPLKIYLESISETLLNEGLLAMKFLKNVSQGDKRIVVAGGEIMGASLRMPAKGNWLCNVAQGGYAVRTEPTEREVQIVQSIAPKLLKEGIFMFGADTLVNDDGHRVLSEVNTLSIGGIPQMEAQTGRPIVQQVITKLIEYVKSR